jgi:hypothetical protein
MRKKFDKKTIILAAAALMLTASLTVGSAMAYFTTYSTASGSVPLQMGFTETVPEETIDGDGKHITISNVGDYDCFVRVKVFGDLPISYTPSEGWVEGENGYWYYTAILAPKAATSQLLAGYTYPVNTEENTTEEFNIVVVQECAPVIYDDAGSLIDPVKNWDKLITADIME